MGLSATLNIAQSSLATNAALSSIVSRNIAGVNDPELFAQDRRGLDQRQRRRARSPACSAPPTTPCSRTFFRQFGLGLEPGAADGLDQLEQTIGLTATIVDEPRRHVSRRR